MLRIKANHEISRCIVDGQSTITGYDYKNQAWVVNGVYQRCGHPEAMNCGCYGREHAGQPVSVNGQVR